MANPQVLRDMALFVEVAKRLSFSQAARALDMPISSLSRRITLFEAAVGQRLLDRTTRKIVLTAYGEAYLAQATRLVEEAERSFDEPRGSSLVVRKVAQVENGLFAAPSDLGARGRPGMPRDLEDHQVILPKQGLSGEWRMTREEVSAAVSVRGPISCNNPAWRANSR